MNLRIPPRVTDRAFRKIADSCESKTLRVAVKGGGCSGFQYIFNTYCYYDVYGREEFGFRFDPNIGGGKNIRVYLYKVDEAIYDLGGRGVI